MNCKNFLVSHFVGAFESNFLFQGCSLLEIFRQLLDALNLLAKWPLLESGTWDRSAFDFTLLLAAARRDFGNEIFFQVYVYADAKNTTKNTLYVKFSKFAYSVS